MRSLTHKLPIAPLPFVNGAEIRAQLRAAGVLVPEHVWGAEAPPRLSHLTPGLPLDAAGRRHAARELATGIEDWSATPPWPWDESARTLVAEGGA